LQKCILVAERFNLEGRTNGRTELSSESMAKVIVVFAIL